MDITWDFSTFREALGFCVGLVYLYLEYKADVRLWIVSIIMPMISMWVYFSKGLYADFGINIYYLVMALYGYLSWTRGGKKKDEEEKAPLPVSHVPLPVLSGCVATTLVLWGAIWWILVTFTDSTVPVADAFTTAASIVGLWMVARKYAEVWILWFIVNIVSSALYFYKGLPFYSTLYAIYMVISLFGYRNWLRLIPKP